VTKHILLYTDEPGLGGIAQYNHAILLGLQQRGYRVTLAQSKAENPLIQQQRSLGIQQEWLTVDTVQQFSQTLTDAEEAIAIFQRTQPDLILFSDGCPVSNFAAKQAALQLGIPYAIGIGFVDPDLAETFANWIPKLSQIYTQAKAVVAVSQENLRLLRQYFHLPQSYGEVIHSGRPDSYFEPPDLTVRDRLRQSVGIPADAIVCFTAARLEGIKGYQFQLDAIAQLRHTPIGHTLYFAWAGEGSLRSELETAIEDLDTDQIKLLGQRWDVAEWLDAADIFVLPTFREGMPIAIMEAMAKGLPVVATAVSGIPEELGETGKLLPDPNLDPQATLQALIQTLQGWATHPDLRLAIGAAAKQRARVMFREARMVEETARMIARSLLPAGDYVSPGLAIVQPDAAFPHKVMGDPHGSPWQYLRREIPHNWYIDARQPIVGFLSRDEAQILYNTALQFQGKPALEIGCWLGWSACHLALADVKLDVIDPLLESPAFYSSVHESLSAAGVRSRVNLVPGYSPQQVEALAAHSRQWSLIFIDGDHDAPAPLQDAIACEPFAAEDAIILFHDLASPDVAAGLDYLKQRGWNTMVYQTMQIMGVAWRGNVQPIAHRPDPAIDWQLPAHLRHYPVSGLAPLETNPMLRLLAEVEALPLPQPIDFIAAPDDRQQIAQLHQQGMQAYVKADLETAQSLYEQVIALHPQSAIAQAKLSDLAWKQQDLRRSLRHHALANADPSQENKQQNPEFQSLLAIVRPYTLLSDERLFSLYALAKQICLDNIPGNFVECGTCRGGAAALLAAVVQCYSLFPRKVYACDTFEGMPEPTESDRHDGIPANLTGFGVGTLKAPASEYLNVVCRALGVGEIVVPIAGLFADTLPRHRAAMGQIALLHADGDWYESTWDIFTNLFEQVTDDGFIQIDDYGHWEGCRQAVHEFERSQNAAFALRIIDYTGVWFRKTDPSSPADNHWRSLWYLAETAAQTGDLALAERAIRAVLRLLPGLVQAEVKLMQFGKDSQSSPRQMHLPEFLRDRQAQAELQVWLRQTLRLRDTNLLLCPDWNQPEAELFPALAATLQELMTRSDRRSITLLIHPGKLDPEEVDLAISSVVMYLLSDAELQLDDQDQTLEITVLPELDDLQWQALRSEITEKIS
jgi:glycosyltransferase involved in cell wall biosynthesis/predicted O-methyltransferase YrrM